MSENTSFSEGSVFVLHGQNLYRDIVVLSVASVLILKFGILCETVN